MIETGNTTDEDIVSQCGWSGNTPGTSVLEKS